MNFNIRINEGLLRILNVMRDTHGTYTNVFKYLIERSIITDHTLCAYGSLKHNVGSHLTDAEKCKLARLATSHGVSPSEAMRRMLKSAEKTSISTAQDAIDALTSGQYKAVRAYLKTLLLKSANGNTPRHKPLLVLDSQTNTWRIGEFRSSSMICTYERGGSGIPTLWTDLPHTE